MIPHFILFCVVYHKTASIKRWCCLLKLTKFNRTSDAHSDTLKTRLIGEDDWMSTTKLLWFELPLRVWGMLILQTLTWLAFRLSWLESGYYWALQLTLLNGVLLWLLLHHFKEHRLLLLLKNAFTKPHTKTFLKHLFPLITLAVVPNILLSYLLYQDPQAGPSFLLNPLPLGFLVLNLTVFPLLQGLVELPFYFSYLQPKLKRLTSLPLLYVGLPILFLSLQHTVMPLRFEALYVLYRSLMFFPFAVYAGVLLYKRPSLLPYLMALHVAMNASLYPMIFIP